MIALAFGSMTCVDLVFLFMLKIVVCFYNRKSTSSSFNASAGALHAHEGAAQSQSGFLTTLLAKYHLLLAAGQPKIREIIETENKPSGLQSEAALNCNLRQQC
jgi:hypothetical protein